MMKNLFAGILLLLIVDTCLCQTITDTIKNEKKNKLKSGINSAPDNLPMQLLNPIEKNVFGKSELPLNLQIYSRVFANDFKPTTNFSLEDLASGLSDEELTAFNNNKTRLQKILTDFYGEDLINIEKLLESLGLTRDQVVALAALLKFVLVQGMLASPN